MCCVSASLLAADPQYFNPFLHILICLYDNLCEIPEDNGRTMAVFVEHAPDVWNMCLGCEVNSSQVVCPTGPPALRDPPCVL